MNDKARIKIAAVVTALFLSAVSLVGLATHTHTPQAIATPAPAAIVQQTPTAPATLVAPEHEDGEND